MNDGAAACSARQRQHSGTEDVAFLEATRERVGPAGSALLTQVLGRVVRVTEPGIEFKVLNDPSSAPRVLPFPRSPTASSHRQPAWLKKHPVHDKWRWLSGLRALKEFDKGDFEKVFGLFANTKTVGSAILKLDGRNFAQVGALVTVSDRYRGAALVGALGQVLGFTDIGGRRVRWTPRVGAKFEEKARLVMLKGYPGLTQHFEGRLACDRCRSKDNQCVRCNHDDGKRKHDGEEEEEQESAGSAAPSGRPNLRPRKERCA